MSQPVDGRPLEPFALGRRLLGVLLLLLVVLPGYRLLAGPETGLAGAQTVAAADRYYVALWRDTALVLLAALLPALLLRGGELERVLEGAGRLIRGPSRIAFAGLCGLVAVLLSGWVAAGVLRGQPALTDVAAQLVQGRYVAAGSLAGPPLDRPEFWTFQFMLDTPAGWVSQYPPLHTLLLGAGLAAGAVWLVGPVLAGIGAFFTALAAERLLPDRPAVARLGGLLAGASPFLAGLAGANMSHAAAGALAALAAWLALRAADGPAAWALAAGGAAGAMLAARPLSGLVIGTTVTAGVWIWGPGGARPGPGGSVRPIGGGAPPVDGTSRGGGDRPSLRLVRAGEDGSGTGRGGLTGREVRARLGLACLGALPFAAGLALYNARFFGSPFRLGYIAGAGPRHGLGFHRDPWGNAFGPLEGIGYTSADLLALGRDLLGTPIPAVALVGLFLLLVRRLAPGVRILLAWALLPALAHAFYWHHDVVLGPRMLGEAAPAWAVLAAVAAVALVRRVPRDHRPRGAFSPRGALAGAFLIALAAGLLWVGPRRLLSLGERVVPEPAWISTDEAGGRPRAATPAEIAAPSLVFVHEAWEDRIGARLVARGVRLDSVRGLLGRQPPCRLEARLEGLRGEDAQAACRRQRTADRFGTLSLPTRVWRGDLPGLERGGPMWVRDLGPALNRRMLEAPPERVPRVLLPPPDGAGRRAAGEAGGAGRAAGRPRPVVLPYEAGMALLWGEPGGSPEAHER